jgi:hypothetical protein
MGGELVHGNEKGAKVDLSALFSLWNQKIMLLF